MYTNNAAEQGRQRPTSARADRCRGHIVNASMVLHETMQIKIHQRGVQWKQGVVVYIILQAVLLYNTTPLRMHPPLMNTPQTIFVRYRSTARVISHGLVSHMAQHCVCNVPGAGIACTSTCPAVTRIRMKPSSCDLIRDFCYLYFYYEFVLNLLLLLYVY